jgi:hypothetical protein
MLRPSASCAVGALAALLALGSGGCARETGGPDPAASGSAAAPVSGAPSGAGAPAAGATTDPGLVEVPELAPEQRQQAEAFYRGQTVRIIVGSGAGGGFDTTARLVARHLPRHVPGSPTVIVENMPGAGGLLAANHLFYAAPKDGLVIGIFHEAQLLNQLIQADGVRFDLRNFNWLGSSYVDPNVCIVRSDAPVKTFKELIGNSTPILIGGTGPGSNTYDVPRVLAAATGANIKAVAGYPTTNAARLGVERGEIHGVCFGWESIKTTAGQWLETRYARVLVQNGATPHPDLAGVPRALEFAKGERGEHLLRLIDASGEMSKPFAAPPGVDPGRVEVLRHALLATYQDPAFLAEASTMHLEFEPKTAGEIQQVVHQVLAAPAEVVAEYKQISAR